MSDWKGIWEKQVKLMIRELMRLTGQFSVGVILVGRYLKISSYFTQSTLCFLKKLNRLMLFKEIISVYFEINMKLINAHCGKDADLF
jgi:hypothetical protein